MISEDTAVGSDWTRRLGTDSSDFETVVTLTVMT